MYDSEQADEDEDAPQQLPLHKGGGGVIRPFEIITKRRELSRGWIICAGGDKMPSKWVPKVPTARRPQEQG